MKWVMCCLVLCVAGCLTQGAQGVYYVTVEIEYMDENTDGVHDGVLVFLVFKDRDFEPISFHDAACTAVIEVYEENEKVYEKEIVFDSSTLVGRTGGGIPVALERGLYDVRVSVVIEGRGEFHSEKKDVQIG